MTPWAPRTVKRAQWAIWNRAERVKPPSPNGRRPCKVYRTMKRIILLMATVLISGCDLPLPAQPPIVTEAEGETALESELPLDTEAERETAVEPEEWTSPWEFDGFWYIRGIYDPGQAIVGESFYSLEVATNIPFCVDPGGPFDTGRRPRIRRPITIEDGTLRVEFSMDFLPFPGLDHIGRFAEETTVHVTIMGNEVPTVSVFQPPLLLHFDIEVTERFVMSGTVLRSTGQAEFVRKTSPWNDDTLQCGSSR